MAFMTDFDKIRETMVETQIRAVKVTDGQVIDAFRATPRERFVPPHLRAIAYVDEDLRIKGDRFMTEPMVLARLLQAAAIGPSDAVLVIGCTTGYAVAVVARLAATVVGLEDDAELVAHADSALARLETDNGVVVTGTLEAGYPKQAPYDVIVIEGRCGELPEGIVDQLAPGGRLVTVMDEDGVGKAVTVRRGVDGSLARRTLFDASIPPLASFARAPGFRF